jgi:hypothetical protein
LAHAIRSTSPTTAKSAQSGSPMLWRDIKGPRRPSSSQIPDCSILLSEAWSARLKRTSREKLRTAICRILAKCCDPERGVSGASFLFQGIYRSGQNCDRDRNRMCCVGPAGAFDLIDGPSSNRHSRAPTGRRSDELMMVHRINPARLRILRHTFCSGLESTFPHRDKHPEPDMKWQKLLFLAVGPLPCPKMAGQMHFAEALRTRINGQTPELCCPTGYRPIGLRLRPDECGGNVDIE